MDSKSEKTQAFVQSDATQPISPPEDDLTGRTLGEFQILRRLGQGGMGQVFLARQGSLNREVALKFLKAELAANKTSLQRFKKEAESIGRVTHANIVHIYGIYEVDGMHFMALEYVEGRNLREYMERKRIIDVRTGLNIMSQVAAALQRASELGIVHRDIKPENILLTKKEEVKVADFGLSRCFSDPAATAAHLTQSNVTMGTPLYMSPEQVEGKKTIDQRSDIYSFGVTCYHMFAGHPPFRGESPFEVAVQHVQKEPQPLNEIRPDLPAELVLMVHRMMAKNVEARFQTAGEMGRDINRLRDLLSAMASGITPAGMVLPRASADALQALSGTHLSRQASGNRSILFLPMLAILVAGAGLALGWWWENTSPPSPDTRLLERPHAKDEKIIDETKKKIPELPIDPAWTPFRKGLALLKEKDLTKAEETFQEVANNDKFMPQRMMGKLGLALVAAFKNDPAKSNQLFLEVLTNPIMNQPPPARNLIPWRSPVMLELIAEALHFNFVNDPLGFPPELRRYRVPPPPTVRPKEPAIDGK